MKVCNARRVLVSHKGKQSDMTFVMNKLWGWIPSGSRLYHLSSIGECNAKLI